MIKKGVKLSINHTRINAGKESYSSKIYTSYLHLGQVERKRGQRKLFLGDRNGGCKFTFQNFLDLHFYNSYFPPWKLWNQISLRLWKASSRYHFGPPSTTLRGDLSFRKYTSTTHRVRNMGEKCRQMNKFDESVVKAVVRIFEGEKTDLKALHSSLCVSVFVYTLWSVLETSQLFKDVYCVSIIYICSY